MNSKTQLLHLIYSLGGFGEASIRKVMQQFATAEDILSATQEDFLRAKVSPKATDIFFSQKSTFSHGCEKVSHLESAGISVFSLEDSEYPKLLREIPDAPPLLYIRGNRDALDIPCVAIVGTRKPTDYGRHVARTLSRDLARAGVVVVSGLALGLDAEVHLGALEARGITAAVLGNGLNDHRIAPRNNFPLAQKILGSNGTLVSEFPPDTAASVLTFPLRNRIIAGLCQGVVIVEAGEKSDTLITARLTLDYNRELFAVPGSILSPLSQGANRLLKDGARVVTCAGDILETLAFASSVTIPTLERKTDSLPHEDRIILNTLSSGPLTLQGIAHTTNLSPAALGTRLTMLELTGYIRDIGGGKYIRV